MVYSADNLFYTTPRRKRDSAGYCGVRARTSYQASLRKSMKDSGVPLCDSMRQFSYTGPFAQKLLIRRCRLSSICTGMCMYEPMMSMLWGPSSATLGLLYIPAVPVRHI